MEIRIAHLSTLRDGIVVRGGGCGIRVSGWDDSEAAASAGLTTVWQSLHDQGAACARIALGGDPPAEPPAWRVVRRTSHRRPTAE
jgi:hypothetical protein